MSRLPLTGLLIGGLLLGGVLLGGEALADGQVQGIVFNADGTPASGAMLQVGGRMVTSDGEGGFVTGLPAGEYELVMGTESWTLRVQDGQVTEVLITKGGSALIEAPEAPVVLQDLGPPGSLIGTLTHAEDSRPMAGARIYVRGLDTEAVSDAQGQFSLELPAGELEISVILGGYSTLSRTVTISPESETQVALELVPAGVKGQDFVVLAPRVEGGAAELLEERRQADTVTEILGAEEMSRSGDSDAASALSRVTGLTVVGGRYVYVRGLGDRYSATTLNGSSLPSPEPERRVVPLDLFPASVLDSVVIQKTMSPDQAAEFGGGVVQLRSRMAPPEPFLNIGLSGAYRHGTTFQQGLTGDIGPTDFLGFGSGYRALPQGLDQASRQDALVQGDLFTPGYTPQDLEGFGESLPNRWVLNSRQLPADFGLDIGAGFGRSFGKDRSAGVRIGVNYGQSWKKLDYERTWYVLSGDGMEPSSTYRFQSTEQSVGLGAMMAAGVQLGEHNVSLVSLVNRDSAYESRTYEGFARDENAIIREGRVRWIERQLVFNQLSGEHVLPVDSGLELDWRYAYSVASRREPDRRHWTDEYQEGSDTWRLSTRSFGNGILYSELQETNHDVGVGLTQPVAWLDGALKVGASARVRDRQVDTRRFRYFDKFAADNREIDKVLAGDSSGYFTPSTIDPQGFQLQDNTQATDNYVAQQRIQAGYMMLSGGTGAWRAMAGFRVEHSIQEVTTYARFDPDSPPIQAGIDNTDFLPSGNVAYSLSDTMQVRAAYGRTVSRPDFREQSPATFFDVTGGRAVFGNPDLQRAILHNVDLRWEWYPQAGESVSVGFFAKRFVAPIEMVIVPSGGNPVTFANAESANNLGLELEGRKALPAAPDFFVAGNLSLIRSRVTLAQGSGIQTSSERPLQGQAPWVFNVQAGYQNPDSGLGFTALYNVAGPRIQEVGALGIPDTILEPTHALDLVVSKGLPAGFKVKLKGQNLINAPARVTQGAEQIESIRSGARVGVSLDWGM